MGKTKKQIHFEQVPIEVVKKIAANPGVLSPACAICGEHVDFENSKTDEHGRAVHETCYVASLHRPTASHSRL